MQSPQNKNWPQKQKQPGLLNAALSLLSVLRIAVDALVSKARRVAWPSIRRDCDGRADLPDPRTSRRTAGPFLHCEGRKRDTHRGDRTPVELFISGFTEFDPNITQLILAA
jgi:hypothetical protein